MLSNSLRLLGGRSAVSARGVAVISPRVIRSLATEATSNEDDCGCIHVSIETGSLNSMKSCLENGVHVDHLNKLEQTPLIAASKAYQVPLVETLMHFSPNLDHCDVFGNTALHYAAGHEDGSKIVDMLLNNGANVHITNSNGETALFDALHHPLFRATDLLARTYGYQFLKRQSNHVASVLDEEFSAVPDIAKKLLERGASLHLKNKFGRPLFHIAAMAGPVDLLKFFIDHGADPHVIHDKSHANAIHEAVQFGNLENVEYLISLGVDVNCKDVNQTTPLHLAAMASFDKICKCLLEHGANPNDTDKRGRTALHMSDCDSVVELLLDHGCEIDKKDNDGRTALNTFHHGSDVINNVPHAFSVECLIRHGADVNTKDNYLNTPLHYAAQYGMRLNMKQLMKAGADINAVNKEGKTPEQVAVTLSDKTLIHNGPETENRSS